MNTEAQNPIHQRIGKVIGGEGASEKAGQRNRHLNGRQKARGLLHEPLQADCALIPVSGHALEFCRIQRKNGNFRTGEHGIEGNENNLQEEDKN